jgi:ABC-2 type transport system ATP-binding protein
MIKLIDLTKRYGPTLAVDHLTLDIGEPGIYCLLGRNGAGKTTLMKLIAGHIPANDGAVVIDGRTVTPANMPENVAYVEANSVQFNMPAGDLISAAADLQADFDLDFANEMAERLKLDLAKKYRQLSFGMRTMLTTIIVLANTGDVILLDEPTLGFDAIMRAQFNTLLQQSFEAHPRVIIISTHLIDEIAKVAQQLIIIDQGKIIVHTGIDDIDERAYTLSGAAADVRPLLAGRNVIGSTTMGSLMAARLYDDRPADLPAGVSIDRLGLQDFFVNLVEGTSNE